MFWFVWVYNLFYIHQSRRLSCFQSLRWGVHMCLGTGWQHTDQNHKKKCHFLSLWYTPPPFWVTPYLSSYWFACVDFYMVQSICHLFCDYTCTKKHGDRFPSMNRLFTPAEIAKRGSQPAKLHQPKLSSQRFLLARICQCQALVLTFFCLALEITCLEWTKNTLVLPSAREIHSWKILLQWPKAIWTVKFEKKKPSL